MFHRILRPFLGFALLASALSGCGPSFSPDIYASNAAQLANKVDQGIVVGVRAINISADATVGTATGGAAGGIAGSQVGAGAGGALGALGGSVAGGVVGNVVAHAAGDSDGFEYIVRKPNGELLSVTQKDAEALPVGAHVLVIEGPQARIVIDYTVPVESLLPHEPHKAKEVTSVVPPTPEQPKPAPNDIPPAAPVQVTTTALPSPQPSSGPTTAATPTVAPPAAPAQVTTTPIPAPSSGGSAAVTASTVAGPEKPPAHTAPADPPVSPPAGAPAAAPNGN